MLSIRCTRCHRKLFSAARPRPGTRCPVCGGPIEATDEPVERGHLAATAPPVQRAAEGSYADGYASLMDFAIDDDRRLRSHENDLGLRWLDRGGRMHRAAWVTETGELTLIQCGPPDEGGGHVEVLGVFADRYALEAALDGWRERCGRPASVEWLRERASRSARSVRARARSRASTFEGRPASRGS